MKIVRVALDVPIATLFDYRADDALASDVGCRTLVPFGKKDAIGVIVEVASHSNVPPNRLKRVHRILRDFPALSGADLGFLEFAAGYYHHALGATVMNSLPARLRRVQRLRAAPAERYVLTPAGDSAAVDELPARAVVKRRLLAVFKECRALHLSAIRTLSPSAQSALKDLVARGWVTAQEPPPLPPAAPLELETAAGPPLTTEQTEAAASVRARFGEFAPFLLLGVTGSGKTEVYLRVIDDVLRAGHQALLLVPEIALTPQLEAVVCSRFPAAMLTTLHSALNESERLEHWLAAQSGRARIVLGTRLAVFAPMPELGLIVVDEEHDASFKQMEGIRYSARDLAVVRARQRDVPIVLGSATPSLETFHNAVKARYQLLTLSQRIHSERPHIKCIDTRSERLTEGLSQALLDAVALRLERGEQSMVFLNRRGYAPVLMCGNCGWLSGCHRCSSRLVLHLKDRRLHCHHCGHHAPVPAVCPKCGNQDLTPIGQGTQRVEAALLGKFPQARILRVDRDSTRRRLAWPAMRRDIHERRVDILVGTQILAKGHDFPHLNLVGVVNADTMLYSADFRAPERLFALLTQVSGRAGRGKVRGEVLIQTAFPHHPLYAALRNQDFNAFGRGLLEERKNADFPPFVHQALLRAEAPKLETALAFLKRAARIARAMKHRVTIYDPVPADMYRLAGRERAHLLVQSALRSELQQFLTVWHAELSSQRSHAARWSLDVDPLEF